jgi:hypothetical protein
MFMEKWADTSEHPRSGLFIFTKQSIPCPVATPQMKTLVVTESSQSQVVLWESLLHPVKKIFKNYFGIPEFLHCLFIVLRIPLLYRMQRAYGPSKVLDHSLSKCKEQPKSYVYTILLPNLHRAVQAQTFPAIFTWQHALPLLAELVQSIVLSTN